MKISQLIQKLETLKKKHGDLRVTSYETLGVWVKDCREPQIKEIRAKRGRETKLRYKQSWDKDKVIEKVCHI